MRLVYVAGWMRSGTTLLGRLLGDQQGFFNAGEVHGLWRAIARDYTCACGTRVRTCPVWAPSIADTMKDLEVSRPSLLADRLDQVQTRAIRMRYLRRELAGNFTSRGVAHEEFEMLRIATRTLLGHAMRETAAEFLVDTSKLASFLAYETLEIADQVHAIHLVRDPRGVALSEVTSLRAGAVNPESPSGRGLVASLVAWSYANLSAYVAARRLDIPYRRIDYETLVQSRSTTMDGIGGWLGRYFRDEPDSRSGHCAMGNPSRFLPLDDHLRVDDRWRSELAPSEQLLVRAITAPARTFLAQGRPKTMQG